MAGKISKDKKKYIIAAISGILVIILILTAYSINSAKNDKKPTTDVSVEDSDKKLKVNHLHHQMEDVLHLR